MTKISQNKDKTASTSIGLRSRQPEDSTGTVAGTKYDITASTAIGEDVVSGGTKAKKLWGYYGLLAAAAGFAMIVYAVPEYFVGTNLVSSTLNSLIIVTARN